MQSARGILLSGARARAIQGPGQPKTRACLLIKINSGTRCFGNNRLRRMTTMTLPRLTGCSTRTQTASISPTPGRSTQRPHTTPGRIRSRPSAGFMTGTQAAPFPPVALSLPPKRQTRRRSLPRSSCRKASITSRTTSTMPGWRLQARRMLIRTHPPRTPSRRAAAMHPC